MTKRLAAILLVATALVGGLALGLPLAMTPHSQAGTVYCGHLFNNPEYATYCTIPTR